jgi:hypothetical protein
MATANDKKIADSIHKVIKYHMDRLNGVLYDDKTAWNEIHHQRTSEEYLAIKNHCEDLIEKNPSLLNTFKDRKRLMEGLDHIERRLKAKEPLIVKGERDYNKPTQSAIMTWYDFVNHVNNPSLSRIRNMLANKAMSNGLPAPAPKAVKIRKEKPQNKFNDLFDLGE